MTLKFLVQLLHKLSIRATNGPEKLFKVIKNPITDHLPSDCRKIGNRTGIFSYEYVKCFCFFFSIQFWRSMQTHVLIYLISFPHYPKVRRKEKKNEIKKTSVSTKQTKRNTSLSSSFLFSQIDQFCLLWVHLRTGRFKPNGQSNRFPLVTIRYLLQSVVPRSATHLRDTGNCCERFNNKRSYYYNTKYKI